MYETGTRLERTSTINALDSVNPRERIPTLDGLRAVAIAAVMISHGFILTDQSSRSARVVTYTDEQLGAVGVALFFAISGYLITMLLLDELETAGRVSLLGFYVRRTFRILPAAYLYLLALELLAKPVARGEMASAAFFFSNYWPDRLWFTQHFWSLSMEEHFYLFWPVLLAHLGPQRAFQGALALVALVAVWRPWSLSHVMLSVPALQRTDMRLDAFLYAAALAIALRSWRRRALMEMICTRRFRLGGTFLFAATSGWAVAGSAPALATLAQSALLPALIVSMIAWRGSWLYRLLESPSLRWIGRISYGLYLWQQFFLVAHSAHTLEEAAWEFLPGVVGTGAAAAASYYLMERPLLRTGRVLSERFGSVATSAQVSWKNEPDAQITEGSAGVRQRARGQAS